MVSRALPVGLHSAQDPLAGQFLLGKVSEICRGKDIFHISIYLLTKKSTYNLIDFTGNISMKEDL